MAASSQLLTFIIIVIVIINIIIIIIIIICSVKASIILAVQDAYMLLPLIACTGRERRLCS